MVQCFLVFRGVVAIYRCFDVWEMGNYIVGMFFTLKLYKLVIVGDEYVVMFGNCWIGKFSVFVIGVGVSNGYMCDLECGYCVFF